MNKPVSIKPSALPAYDADTHGWALAQSSLIRGGQFDAVDWENVAEEIESVGKSELGRAESALRVLMAHILKWQMQPERRGKSWSLTILEQRLRYDDVIAQNPSLKTRRDEMRERAYRRARIEAARETEIDLDAFGQTPPEWTVILDQPFVPENK